MTISDNQNELLDIINKKDEVIGQATRGEVHRNKNLIHRSIAIAVFNSRGELFLQKRSATKDTDPLKWTISCSGHVSSGNTYEETAIRELREELGINFHKGTPRSTAGGPLEKLIKYLCRAPGETEMSVLFKTIWDKPMKLQPEEIIEGRFFTQKELLSEIKSGQINLSFMGKMALERLGWIK